MAPRSVQLVLGPMLRYVDERTATVWVETSHSAEVEVLGHRSRTVAVGGHHYALVAVDGLEPGSDVEYSVSVDGAVLWPEPDDPRPGPRIRTLSTERALDLAFGSCRVDRPQAPPWTLPHGQHPDAVGIDALVALAHACRSGRRRLPDVLLLLGDQVYADKRLAPAVRDRQARDAPPGAPPAEAARTFQEYVWVYQNSWSQPDIRWLLSTVPSIMILDDHEVRNNWNISAAWRREVTPTPGWQERITGAYMAYWLYQHLGNLSPAMLREEGLWPALQESPDGEARLREFARHADDEVNGRKKSQWSYVRDLGRTRLVVIDTRSGRILETGRRAMLSDAEWEGVEHGLRGDCDHLLVASSLPLLLARSLHDLESWNEAVCAGAWGSWAARAGERLRRAGNLEHWPAFRRSFDRLLADLRQVAEGRCGTAPSTVLVLSGDVHHSYVAELTTAGHRHAGAPVAQIVSSPLRNALPGAVRHGFRFADSRPARALGRLLASTAGVPAPRTEWSVTTPPLFGNFLASLRLGPRQATLRLEKATQEGGAPCLTGMLEQTLPRRDT